MRLLEPYFLYAFLALAIPIIIHLFSLRKHKTVYFSNVAFLKQIKDKKNHINQLQKRLLLLIRLLALSAIILAFCEPYISNNDAIQEDRKIIGIYIDNSFSMAGENEKGVLIEQAKNKARNILNAHKEKDQFIFISNDLKGKHQRVLDAKNSLLAIDETEINASVLNLESILNRWNSLKQNETISSCELYLISDFQKSIFPEKIFLQDTTYTTHLIPIESYPQSNLSIDTCFLESPSHHLNQQEHLSFKLTNTSDEDLENISVKLTLNGKTKAITSTSIKAYQSKTSKINFTNQSVGVQKAMIEVSDATLDFDNRLYFNFDVVATNNVLNIYEQKANKSLQAVFNDTIFSYKESEVGALNLNIISTQDLLILAHVKKPTSGLVNTLKNYINQGGALLIIPPFDLHMTSYQRLAEELQIPSYTKHNKQELKVANFNTQHDIFKDVFEKESEVSELPKVNFHYHLSDAYSQQREPIMELNSKASLIESYEHQQGIIYVMCSPLDENATNLDQHALFVPLLHNMATQKKSDTPLYFNLGETRNISVKNSPNEGTWKIKREGGINLIPEAKRNQKNINLKLHNLIQEDGFYSLVNGREKHCISFNFDRKESELELWESQNLIELSNSNDHLNIWGNEGLDLENSLKEYRSGFALWQFFIFTAMILLIIESLLLKNWKKKTFNKLDNEDLSYENAY